jgi:hypothetical protein
VTESKAVDKRFAGMPFGDALEAAIGTESVAFAGEHACRILVFALEGKDAGGEREGARHILAHQETQHFTLVLVGRQRHLADARPGERGTGQAGTFLLVADFDDVLVLGVQLDGFRPHVEQLASARVELPILPVDQLVEIAAGRFAAGLKEVLGGAQRLPLARDFGLFGGMRVVSTHAVGNLGQVAHALRRHDRALVRRLANGNQRQLAFLERQAELKQTRQHRLIKRGDAVVVEARSHGAEDRHFRGTLTEGLVVALILLAHVAQGVIGALAVEFVDGHEIGEIEHVDLLELRRGAELGRHHIQRGVDQRHDGRVALTNPRGFDDHQIEAGQLAGGEHFGQGGRELGARVTRRQRAHVDVRMLDGVHPDAVAEQRTTGTLARGVDGNDRQLDAVALVEPEAAHQFVGQRRLAGAAGASDAEGRDFQPGGRINELLAQRFRIDTVLQRRNHLRQMAAIAALSVARTTSGSCGASAERSKSELSRTSLIIPCRPID